MIYKKAEITLTTSELDIKMGEKAYTVAFTEDGIVIHSDQGLEVDARPVRGAKPVATHWVCIK